MTLIRPDFVVLDAASVDGYARQEGTDVIAEFFQVLDPMPGVWSMVVENPESGDYVVDLFAVNSPPVVTLLSPSDTTVNSTDSVFIQWDAPDPEGDSLTFSVYYGLGTTSSSAVLVADNLKDTDSYYFHPGALPSGNYDVFVYADDGHNPPTPCDNPGSITVFNSDPPDQPALKLPISGNRSIRLRWSPSSAPDLMGYILYWAEKDSTSLDSIDIGGGTSYLLRNLRNEALYRFGLKAYDYDRNTSAMSTWKYGMPTPLADATPPLIPLCSLNVDNIPTSIDVMWPEVGDAAGYRIYYDTDPRLPYAGTGLSEGDSPVEVFNDTILTLSGFDPGATYYFAISSYDAIGNESDLGFAGQALICCSADLDADGLDDDWEIYYFGDTSTVSEAAGDYDEDLSDNYEELSDGSDPTDPDTDKDRVPDGVDDDPIHAFDLDGDLMPDDWEAYRGVEDPNADHDEDLLYNLGEYQNGTLPFDADSDDDGFLDGVEVNAGTDPLDPADFPISSICGDADGSGSINVSDAVYLIAYIFGDGAPPLDISSGDLDCSERLNLSDVVYLIAYIFGGGPAPCDPNNDGAFDCYK